MFLDLFTAFALFCDADSQVASKDKCEKLVACTLKELEGPITTSQIEINQEVAIEKCTREIICKSNACSEKVAR